MQEQQFATLLAEEVVQRGVSIRKDDVLYIKCPVSCAHFARELSQKAYAAEAAHVSYELIDPVLAELNRRHSTVVEAAPWELGKVTQFANERQCWLYIDDGEGEDLGLPELTCEEEAAISKRSCARSKARKELLGSHNADVYANKMRWCVVSYPTHAWAKKVYGDTPDAMEKLVAALMRIFKEDPEAELKRRCKALTDLDIRELHYSSQKTNLRLGFKGAKWIGGSELLKDTDIHFNPNMPSFEIFTGPDPCKADGHVALTKPLVLDGGIVREATLYFEDGKVTKVESQDPKSQQLMEDLIAHDSGACRLGEVALVPHKSPISNEGVIFYSTLLDENAACHLALGEAYVDCFHDPSIANKSTIHVDMMVGDETLDIIALCEDGRKVQIFKAGEFAL